MNNRSLRFQQFVLAMFGCTCLAGLATQSLADDSAAIDFAFIRPDFVQWWIDRRDTPGGCQVLGQLNGPWQWGLPQDKAFLAGEPLASHSNGRDDLIIVRPDYANPSLLRWWVKHNDQDDGITPGGFSGAWSEGSFGLVNDTPFMWKRHGGPARAAVYQQCDAGPCLIRDENRNLAYDPGTDSVYLWNVPLGPNDRIFGASMGTGASTIVVYRAASSIWELYLDIGNTISETPYAVFAWGTPGMIPAVADVNADGFADLILFNPATKIVYVNYYSFDNGPTGFNHTTDCTLNYAPKLNAIQTGPWFQFVAMNLGGFDDWDGDGVPNDQDECPWDPNKIVPGVCGCGVPDFDTNPPAPVLQQSSCGSATLARVGSPPSGVTWYWQQGNCGQSTSQSGATLTVTTSGNYYLRARRNDADCWSACSPALNVNVPGIPSAPLQPVIASLTCDEATLAFGGALPSGVNWYWQGTSCGTSTNHGDSTYTVTQSGTYYLRARSNSGCWSEACSSVHVELLDCSCPLLGDLNCDGVVNVSDLLILFSQWGPCDDPDDCPADLNGDDVVNVTDMLILFAIWG